MPDREKVIKGLECCVHPHGNCTKCPYDDDSFNFAICTSKLCSDALAMLKEQEAVEPFKTELHDGILERDLQYNACGCCGFILYPKSNYCPNCGKKVKYN